jgi:hypothetical protein
MREVRSPLFEFNFGKMVTNFEGIFGSKKAEIVTFLVTWDLVSCLQRKFCGNNWLAMLPSKILW